MIACHHAWRLVDIDAQTMNIHHGKHHQTYVTKLNEITTKLAAADRSTPNYSFNEYSELRRREPVAFNGTVLHEMYFAGLGDGSTAPSAGAWRRSHAEIMRAGGA